MQKLELLKGTKEELEDYFYKEIGVKEKSDDAEFIVGLAKNSVAYSELSETNTIKKQIEDIESYQKPIGMVAYLKAIRTGEILENNAPTIHLTIESKFIYVINQEIREKIQKELFNIDKE